MNMEIIYTKRSFLCAKFEFTIIKYKFFTVYHFMVYKCNRMIRELKGHKQRRKSPMNLSKFLSGKIHRGLRYYIMPLAHHLHIGDNHLYSH